MVQTITGLKNKIDLIAFVNKLKNLFFINCVKINQKNKPIV